MPDPFTPSPSSILNLGKAVNDMFFTIADKMDAAQAATQFNNGQESLRRSVTQFELDLQSDPDWRKYDQKAAKFINDAWQPVDKVVQHQGAKNALQTWWMSQRDSLMARVGQAQYNARANETIATANKNIDQVMQDVVSGNLTSEVAKAKLRNLQDPLVRSNLTDAVTAEQNYKNWNHTVDIAAVTHQAFTLVRPQVIGGVKGLPNFDAAHEFLSNPKNTVGLSGPEVEAIDNRITHMETVQDSEDKRTNDKLEQPLGEMFSKVMTGDAGLPEFKALIQQSRQQWVGKEKGERDKKWAGFYEAEVRAARVEARSGRAERGGYDTEEANNLQTTMFDPEMTKEQKFNLISQTQGLTANDRKKLASSIKNSSTVLHDSAARIQGYSAKDENGNPGPLDAEDVKIGHAMLQEMVDKKPDLTPDQISKETDSIVEFLKAKKVRAALKNAFQGARTELLQAEKMAAGMGPLLQTRPAEELTTGIGKEQSVELKKKGITATVIKIDQKGRPVFQDDKANLYVQDNGVWHMKMRTVIEAGRRREGEWLIMP